MNNDYYYTVQKRTSDNESNTENIINESAPLQTNDTLLVDYEIVENELGSASVDQPVKVNEGGEPPKTSEKNLRFENNAKLLLNLSSEKIALKSAIAKSTRTNKSSLPEAELAWYSLRNANLKTIKQQQRQQTTKQLIGKREPHVPKPFTITPIDVARTNETENVQQSGSMPAILLKSYQQNYSKNCTINPAHSRRATNASIMKKKLINIAVPSVPTIPPPAEFARRASSNPNQTIATKLDTAETSDRSTQPDSSTSPESVLDQILSAASSLSIPSSSLSSGTTELTPLPSLANKNNHNADNENANNERAMQHVVKGFNKIPIPITTATTNTLVSTVAATTTLTTNFNRMLTLKSTEINISPPVLQITSPSFSQASATELLQMPANNLELCETNSIYSRSPLPSPSISIRITPDLSIYSDELKCNICSDVLRDARTLNCLHSFCYQCLVDENFKHDSSIPFWSQPDSEAAAHTFSNDAHNKSIYSLRSTGAELSLASDYEMPARAMLQRGSSFSLMRKKSLEKIIIKPKPNSNNSNSSSTIHLNGSADAKTRFINCSICNFSTELPLGGLRQLPQNFVLMRKIEAIKLKNGDDIIARIWCSLCNEHTGATYHCSQCTVNLCTLCKDAHERQRTTANHNICNIMELRRARRQKQNLLEDNSKFILKCGMHPGFEIKAFCTICLQVACTDCLVLQHKGHKHEPIGKAVQYYSKILNDAIEHTRPLCNYAEHSIEHMNEIAKNINKKCDEIQDEVETFMNQYYEAIEVHRKTLIQQISRARESKVEMVLEQQLDLEKHTRETLDAVRFSHELTENASDVEILSFLNILLKRFDYCQQFKAPPDPKISDSLHFLPKIRAPSTKSQYEIPLYGIITMQTVEPSLCTLQWEGFSQLRLHKKVEVTLLSRDADGVPLCHGGLTITALIKYKEYNAKYLPVEISDNRDGTYIIAFTPDAQGNVVLTVTINEKSIKGSPFTFMARTVRPHNGIYHCCTFCSSKGNKLAKCSCEGRMPGFNGCGHGHAGHPGRRHWSCCGNVLENSECNVANKLLNS